MIVPLHTHTAHIDESIRERPSYSNIPRAADNLTHPLSSLYIYLSILLFALVFPPRLLLNSPRQLPRGSFRSSRLEMMRHTKQMRILTITPPIHLKIISFVCLDQNLAHYIPVVTHTLVRTRMVGRAISSHFRENNVKGK